MRMIRIRNALSRLIRVGRSRARTPPFIRIVKEQPCPNCGSKFPNRPKVHDEKAGGGDATRRIAQFNITSRREGLQYCGQGKGSAMASLYDIHQGGLLLSERSRSGCVRSFRREEGWQVIRDGQGYSPHIRRTGKA
jgi:hypothetical protein